MDTWWSELETRNMNDHTFVNHSQMMTPFNELPLNKPFSTFSPPPPSNSVISNYNYSNSMSANTVAKNHWENLNTLKVKSEIPSGTTINFSSSINSMDSNFGDRQNLIQAMGFGAADTNTTQKKSYNRTSFQAQDHVLAERKRRERLTQRFIALSTLIPNLKKLDKASVLGDAIQYIKQLEEQVKTLEEKTKKCSEDPVVIAVKRPRLVSSSDDSSSSDEISSISTDRSLPDIEVRASDGNILIRIYCKKQNGMIKEIFNEVDKLHLSIISCSIMPFGYNTSHMTIIAQMDHKMTTNHVADRIRAVMMKEKASSVAA